MGRKKNLRQTQLVTLSDHHREEIERIRRDQAIMTEKYQRKKEGIDRSTIVLHTLAIRL